MKAWPLLLSATLFFACGPHPEPTSNEAEDTSSAGEAFEPVAPAGKVTVSFPVTDTTEIKILFELNGQTKEKSFELPLAKDVEEKDLYRLVWDKPNSCYIGVLKQNRTTRYYHASVDDKGYLQINHVGTPPAGVWQYAENRKGLGKVSVSAKAKLEDTYKKNLQSGRIIADFIVRVIPLASKDSVHIYAEFGGANRTISQAVPAGYKAGVLASADKPAECFIALERDGKLLNTVEIKVDGGHLEINNLR
ncbi:hypothetical protein [Chitinophaga sp. CF418]|uniref:hypothetical protein n=1 Tax=Chitinophaga sp. CF418 TaxID=1855287 RepID=UPI0009242070|nr:hypothetical protein [Chitinophaga sp. CF418]SHN77083.1 hypothetical protein SAMN05216311_11389 [Chitinophaga sp. CF418]